MGRLIPAVVLVCILLLPGCGQSSPPPVSILGRLQTLKSRLATVTVLSERVAGDMTRLAAHVRMSDISGSQREAVRLKADARGFMTRAGDAGNVTRALSSRAPGGPQRQYLQLLTGALAADWLEGSALVRLSDVLWHDPRGMNPQTPRKIRIIESRARRAADRAVSLARRAAQVRSDYPGHFRYVPVTPSRVGG